MGYTPTWALSFPDLNEIAKGRKAVMNLATSVEAALSRLKGDSATDATQKADKALADAKAFTNSAKTELSSRLESLNTLVENETSARGRAIQSLRQDATNLIGQARTTLLAAIATAKKEAVAESKELMDVRVPEPIGPGTTWYTYPMAGSSDGLEAPPLRTNNTMCILAAERTGTVWGTPVVQGHLYLFFKTNSGAVLSTDLMEAKANAQLPAQVQQLQIQVSQLLQANRTLQDNLSKIQQRVAQLEAKP